MRRKEVQWAAIVAVVLLALFLRVWQLDDVPAGLYCDEAGNGWNAYALGTAGLDENGTHWPLYVWSFGTAYKNPLFIYAAILPVKLLGLSAFSIRLAAALFGTATVLAMFFLGRALFGAWVGLWAALFLAVAPWHLHFSRIAFELIAFPLVVVWGCTLLVRFTQGRRTLPAALGIYALGIYAYAPAALFVPAFLIGFGLLFLPELLRGWRQFLVALVVTAAVLAPAAMFFSAQARTGTQYFRTTTFLDPQQPWREQAARFGRNYVQFFSPRFLADEGDPIFRHSVRNFGELYPFFVPFVLLGAGVALLRRDRASKLLLWWLALYPVAPSLMNEIPSATRGIIGAPILCLLAGVGFAAALRALRFLAPRRRWGVALQAVAAVAGLAFLGVQVGRYLHAYFVDYPTYAALTPGAFQFGYRDAIGYMESERANYDLLLLSATDSNQPQIFAQFYRPIDPRDWAQRRDTGYLIIKPEEFVRRPNQRVLAALHPDDVDLFSDLQVKRLVEGPGGKLAFVIAEVGARKRYLNNWLILGLFPNDDGRGGERDPVTPTDLTPPSYKGLNGAPIKWQQARAQLAGVDLNRDFIGADPRNPANPEHVCAYAATTVRSPTARAAVLELSGSLNDTLRVWLNGRPLTPFPMMMGRDPRQRDVELHQGDNGLLVQSCEDIGTWSFSARILDAAGRDMEDIVTVAQLPVAAMQAPPAATDSIQLVEGFAGAAQGTAETNYPDYRGGTASWRARVENQSAVSWRTAPPPAAGPTVFAFTGSTSDEEGDFALAIDGRPTLTFQSHRDREVHSWSGGGSTLVYVPKGSAAGSTGYYLLSVPAEQTTPGVPLELRVTGSGGDPAAWFMIKGYRDTLTVEHLTPALAVEATRSTWRTRALAYSTNQ
ncbi:MAG TPA: glycosyltransferase family 39 protein [Candidatus Dormibacteraeota bacterium]|nr:glycosyltransferase family 39 protein [Candidatus Dormibacteraeota bacterium]